MPIESLRCKQCGGVLDENLKCLHCGTSHQKIENPSTCQVELQSMKVCRRHSVIHPFSEDCPECKAEQERIEIERRKRELEEKRRMEQERLESEKRERKSKEWKQKNFPKLSKIAIALTFSFLVIALVFQSSSLQISNQEINRQYKEIANLNNQINKLNTQVSKLNAQIVELQANLDNTKTFTSNSNSQIKSLQNEIASLNSAYNDYLAKHKYTNSDYENLQSQISSLEAKYASILATLKTKYPWAYNDILNITSPSDESPILSLIYIPSINVNSASQTISSYLAIRNFSPEIIAYNITLSFRLTFKISGTPHVKTYSLGTSKTMISLFSYPFGYPMYVAEFGYMGELKALNTTLSWQNNNGKQYQIQMDVYSWR